MTTDFFITRKKGKCSVVSKRRKFHCHEEFAKMRMIDKSSLKSLVECCFILIQDLSSADEDEKKKCNINFPTAFSCFI